MCINNGHYLVSIRNESSAVSTEETWHSCGLNDQRTEFMSRNEKENNGHKENLKS